MTQAVKEISGTFTGTGNSTDLLLSQGIVSISGTFTATVQLQVYMGGGWKSIDSFTSAEVVTFNNLAPVPTRFECTAYTSGTVTYELQGLRQPQ